MAKKSPAQRQADNLKKMGDKAREGVKKMGKAVKRPCK